MISVSHRYGAPVVALIALLAAAPAPAPTVLVEQTYLKAKPAMRDALRRYIVANWYVLDQRGVDAGIFTSYALHEDLDANPDWDFVMVVGYPQGAGYEDPATKATFTAIRTAHRDVPIDGKTLRDLGAIVGHHRLIRVSR